MNTLRARAGLLGMGRFVFFSGEADFASGGQATGLGFGPLLCPTRPSPVADSCLKRPRFRVLFSFFVAIGSFQ